MNAFIGRANDHVADLIWTPAMCCSCKTLSTWRLIFIRYMYCWNALRIEILSNSMTGKLLLYRHTVYDTYNFGLRKTKTGNQFFRGDEATFCPLTYSQITVRNDPTNPGTATGQPVCAFNFQSRSRLFSILLMRFLHRR